MVRLVGDSSSFNQMLSDASKSLKVFASNATTTLGALGTTSYLKQSLNIFQGQETTLLRLNAVIESNGRNVEQTTESYRAFAKQMADTTTMSETQILDLLKSAESFDLTGSAAKKAVRDATALASITGSSITHVMRIAEAIQKGDIETARAFARYIPQLRGIKDNTEFVTRYNKLLAAGMKSVEAESNSAAGITKRLSNEYHMLLGELGAVVAKGLRPVIDYAREWVKWLRELSPEIKTNIVLIMGLASAFLSFRVAFNYVNLAIAFLTNPLTLLFVAAAAALVIFIHEMGGVQPALNKVKEILGLVKEYIIDITDKSITWITEFVSSNQYLAAALGIVAFAFIAIIGTITSLYEGVKYLTDNFGELVAISIGWAIDFFNANEEVGMSITGVVGAVVSLYAGYQLLASAVSLVNFVLSILHIKQILITVGILLWKGFIIGLSISWTIFAALYTATMAVMWALGMAMIFVVSGHSVAVGLAKAMQWLWNAALAVTKALLWGIVIAIVAVIAAQLAAIVIFAGVAVIISTFVALGAAIWAVIGALASLPTAYGPIAFIKGLFVEWFDIIKDIIRAVSGGQMTLAWEILKLAVQMAILQVKALWPPLWGFIYNGFTILWDLVKIVAVGKFKETMADMLDAAIDFEGKVMRIRLWGALKLLPQEEGDKIIKAYTDQLKGMADTAGIKGNARKEQEKAIADAAQKLKDEAANFAVPEDDDAIKALRERINELRKIVGVENPFTKGKAAEMKKEGFDMGAGLGQGINAGVKHELGKFDATLAFSAEALARFNKYKEQLAVTPEEYAERHSHAKGQRGGGALPGQPVGVAANKGIEGNRDILADIRDILKNQKRVEIAGADIA